MYKHWIYLTLGIFISISTATASVSEENYYRYKDKDGHVVLGNTLPPEAVAQGYEIVTPRGNVLETIPPQKTSSELAIEIKALEKKKEEEKKAEIAKIQADAQARKDDILLRSFTTKDDIIRSRDEKIASILVLEEIVKENISRLQKQLDSAQKSAANYKQAGQNAPDGLQQTIEQSERQINENNAFLARKNTEKQEIHTKYQGLIDRFEQLQNQRQQPVH